MHTSNVKQGLDNVLTMDQLARQTAEQIHDDTLIIFTADHSFDLRLHGDKRGEPLSTDTSMEKSALRMGDDHTGEEALVAAQGPGSERVHGYMPNTEIFQIMTQAYGWKQL